MRTRLSFPLLFWHLIPILLLIGAAVAVLHCTAGMRQQTAGEHLSRLAAVASQLVRKDLDLCIARLETLAGFPEIADPRGDIGEKLRILREHLSVNKALLMGLSTPDGRMVSTGGHQADLNNIPEFKQALAQKSSVTGIVTSKFNSEMIFVIYVPVMYRGKVAAVLSEAHDWRAFNTMLDKVSFAKDSYAYMIDQDGVTIAHPDQRIVINRVNDAQIAAVDPAKKNIGALEKRMLRGETGYGEYVYDGSHKLLGFAPVESTGWSVAVTAPQPAFFSGSDYLPYVLGAAFAASLLTIAIYAICFCRLQRQKQKMETALEGKITELSAAYARQTATENELERQLIETKEFAAQLHTTEELLELREKNRAELYHLINASPAAVVVIDDNLQHAVNCNDTAVHMFSAPDKQTFMEKFMNYLPEKQPDGRLSNTVVSDSVKFFREKGGGDFECMFTTHHGEALPLWVSNRFIEVNGQKLRFSYLQDLRREKRAREIIDTRRAELERLLTNLPVAVEIVDVAACRYVFCNQAFLDLLGLTNFSELENLPFASLAAATQRSGMDSVSALEEIVAAVRRERTYEFDWTLQRNDGSMVETVAYSQLIRYQDKECVLIAFQNVTESIEHTNLLISSVEAADSVNAIRNRFLKKFSYEVRNPLNAIIGIADLLGHNSDKAACSDYLRDLQREAANLRELSKNMLNWDLHDPETFSAEMNLDGEDADHAMKAANVSAPPPPSPDKIAPSAAFKENSPMSSLSILLAEDNSVNRLVARELLLMHHFACDEVEDGAAAVAAVQKKKYDVILMDINMPVLDGDEAAKQIRDLGYNMPIIALTADVTAEERDRYTAVGITDILDKPIKIDELVAILRKVLPADIC